MKELWSGKDPVKKDELEREKQGAILGLPGQFATAQAALGQYRAWSTSAYHSSTTTASWRRSAR